MIRKLKEIDYMLLDNLIQMKQASITTLRFATEFKYSPYQMLASMLRMKRMGIVKHIPPKQESKAGEWTLK